MVKKEEAAREPVAASDVWGCVYNYFFYVWFVVSFVAIVVLGFDRRTYPLPQG